MSNKKDNKKPVDVKKLVLIAAVTVVVVLAAILVDNMIRHPRCQDETGALNVVIQKVLPSLDELADDGGKGYRDHRRCGALPRGGPPGPQV